MVTTLTNSDEIDLARKYTQSIELKPNGLWYSFNGGWGEWCKKNRFGDYQDMQEFVLEIDKSKMILLNNLEDLNRFIDKYSSGDIVKTIDWESVANDYHGIEITNYWALRFNSRIMDSIWVYALDLDSGCIWNLEAIIKTYLNV